MKKLLFTFLVGLVMISCNKEDMGSDYAPSALSTQEIVADPLDDIDIDGLISRLISSSKGKNSKSSAAKTGTAGSSYIAIYTGIISGNLFEIVFDDTQSFCAPEGSGLVRLTLFYASNGDTQVRIGDENGPVVATITDDLSFLYSLDVVVGTRINSDSKEITTVDAVNNIFTF